MPKRTTRNPLAPVDSIASMGLRSTCSIASAVVFAMKPTDDMPTPICPAGTKPERGNEYQGENELVDRTGQDDQRAPGQVQGRIEGTDVSRGKVGDRYGHDHRQQGAPESHQQRVQQGLDYFGEKRQIRHEPSDGGDDMLHSTQARPVGPIDEQVGRNGHDGAGDQDISSISDRDRLPRSERIAGRPLAGRAREVSGCHSRSGHLREPRRSRCSVRVPCRRGWYASLSRPLAHRWAHRWAGSPPSSRRPALGHTTDSARSSGAVS